MRNPKMANGMKLPFATDDLELKYQKIATFE
jgi:hypothetical protein